MEKPLAGDASKTAALRTIARFVLRARLVQEHSLAADRDILEKYSVWTLSFVVTENRNNGERTCAIAPVPLLPTEQVESAAARVRPIFLFSDGVHYENVLRALGIVVVPSADLKKDVERLRAKFQAADPDYPDGRPTEPRSASSMKNKQIAGAWLYGHLLHEDELRRTYSAGISAEFMLLQATKTVCSEMLATVEALHLIERLVTSGSLEIAEDLFTEPISVTAIEWAPQLTNAYVADAGTAMPESLTEPLGSEWKKIQDSLDIIMPSVTDSPVPTKPETS